MSFVFLKFQTLFFGFLGCGSLWYSRHWQGRQPGRISGGAEEPALSSPQWSAGQQHQLAWFPPSHLCLCYACPHLHFFVFSCAVVSSLLGKHHHCPVAEPAGIWQEEGGVCCQTPEQDRYRQVQVAQKEARVHSRGGECKAGSTHYFCATCPVAWLLPSDGDNLH